MSIEDEIKKYAARSLKRWHTPGHKGLLCSGDLTEIDDGEMFPSDSVERAERRAAKILGGKVCRFLLGGSSQGIKAAIMSVGGDVIAPVSHHRCADEGAALARVRLHVMRQRAADDGLFDPPTPKEVERAIDEFKGAKAVLIVSPDYYGRTADATAIEKLVHGRGLALIADSAHGAHFPFRRDLFKDSFAATADFCVMSAHKTLFSPTMTSFMTLNNSAMISALERNLRLLGTTSPSYPMLAAIENAIERACVDAPKYDGLKVACNELSAEVATRKSDDFTRIVVDAAAYGLSGKQLFDRLLGLGHAAEMYDRRYVVFIVTAADTPKDVRSLKESILKVTHER